MIKTEDKTIHKKLVHLCSTIKTRCNNPRRHNYKNYGGRGIKVCRAWKKSKNFVKWALAHGYREGLQIDRIDNNKGYSPTNCRFVTNRENANNRRNSIRINVNGDIYTIVELSKKYRVSEFTLYWWRRLYGDDVMVSKMLDISARRNYGRLSVCR